MKTLSCYTKDKQTSLFNEYGAFFAFSNEQVQEQAQDGLKYVHMGAGLICPKENAKTLKTKMDEIYAEAIQQDITENGPEAIIERELANYECYWTGDIDDCVDALEGYNFTRNQILKIFNETAHGYDNML